MAPLIQVAKSRVTDISGCGRHKVSFKHVRFEVLLRYTSRSSSFCFRLELPEVRATNINWGVVNMWIVFKALLIECKNKILKATPEENQQLDIQ